MKFLFKKLIIYIIDRQHFYLVNVCAWCPKETYPKLRVWQQYTHGICEKHYAMLSKNRTKTPWWKMIGRTLDQLIPSRLTF